MENVYQENLNLVRKNETLNSEITQKSEIIVKLLEVISSTGNEDLINKSLKAIGEVK